jgi:hypothetical protein
MGADRTGLVPLTTPLLTEPTLPRKWYSMPLITPSRRKVDQTRSVRPVGSEDIEEASKPALWYGNLKAAWEKLACRKRHRGV